MLIENSFDVDAEPDRVFKFLQNPHNVATCFPGAELTEDLGDDQYKGKVKIKLGPVTAAFSGTAKIIEKDEAARTAVLLAEGKDARGSGTAKATATMRVEPKEGGGASVLLTTDLTISGKLAQFGRGIMADVSGRMVNDLAVRVRERIEAEPDGTAETPAAEPAAAEAPAGEAAEAKSAETTGAAATEPGGPAEAAKLAGTAATGKPAGTAEPAETAADGAPAAGAETEGAPEAPATAAAGAEPGAVSGATTDA